MSDASGIGKSGCGLECQERRGGFMTSRTHIKSRFTLSGDCLATAAGLIDAVRDAVAIRVGAVQHYIWE